MPTRAKSICGVVDCPKFVTYRGRCDTHARQREQARGRRQARGYNNTHDRLRQRWAPKVNTGTVDCHATDCLEPQRRIQPGTAWDLGHTEDRTAWTGPEHARCNRAAGGHAAHPRGMTP